MIKHRPFIIEEKPGDWVSVLVLHGCLLFKRGQKWVRLWAALDLEHLIPAQSDDLTEGLGGIGVSLWKEMHTREE